MLKNLLPPHFPQNGLPKLTWAWAANCISSSSQTEFSSSKSAIFFSDLLLILDETLQSSPLIVSSSISLNTSAHTNTQVRTRPTKHYRQIPWRKKPTSKVNSESTAPPKTSSTNDGEDGVDALVNGEDVANDGDGESNVLLLPTRSTRCLLRRLRHHLHHRPNYLHRPRPRQHLHRRRLRPRLRNGRFSWNRLQIERISPLDTL